MRMARTWAIGLSVAAGAGLALMFTPAGAARTTDRDGAAEQAANAFLASLPAELRAKVSFAADSPERLAWHYIPKERVGAPLLNLDDAQSELLGPLLASALSAEGLLAARGVMKHENTLRRVESETNTWTQARPRDPGLYYTTVFGTPSAKAPWAWRFEGHHLSINVTQLPGQPPIVAPVFVGANPAKVLTGANAGYRLLAAEEDLGRELITMMTSEHRKVAIIADKALDEIVTRNDPKVQGLDAAGLTAAAMAPAERKQLRRLLELYAARMTGASAKDVLARIDRAGFEKVRFAWAGGTEPGAPHYYRIHGPTVLVEYDNTQNEANHIHTVWRDLERDLGGDALRAHYQGAHGGDVRLWSR